jgi:hypothetical protein
MSETTQVLPSHLHAGVGATLCVVVIALVVVAVVVRMLARHSMGLARGFALLVAVGVVIGLLVRWVIPEAITNMVVSLIGGFALWPYDIGGRFNASGDVSFVWGCVQVALCMAIDCGALCYATLFLTRDRYAAAIAFMLGAAFCTVGFVLGFIMA